MPTDKYSPLVHSTSKYGGLFLSKYYSPMPVMGDSYQHIYITSDEEIKDVRPYEGKWQLEQGLILNKFPTYLTDLSDCKLVIMTTDQDLIKDGVQAIDDTFLEWFVKNPSCEEVVISTYHIKGDISGKLHYKINIPQEEPKQESIQEFIKKHGITRQQLIDGYKQGLDLIFGNASKITKQETLEEAAENYASKKLQRPITIYNSLESNVAEYVGFIEGAKWQAEKMYSETIEFAEWIRIKDFQTTSKNNWIGLDMKYYTTQELFEQFKKK